MIISLASIKGGVGKSCSVASIAGALVRNKKKSYKVLVVDFDASAALTHSLSSKFSQFKASLYDVFQGNCDAQFATHKYEKNLYLIPTGTNWGDIKEHTLQEKMDTFISSVRNDYDFILFDLSPAIFFGSIIPLSYSDYALIPVQSKGGLSILGLDAQIEIIAKLHNQKKKVGILGVFATFVARTKMSKAVVDHLIKECGDEFFISSIRENTSLAEAASLGKLIYDHRPNSNGAKDYTTLTKEMLKRLKSCY